MDFALLGQDMEAQQQQLQQENGGASQVQGGGSQDIQSMMKPQLVASENSNNNGNNPSAVSITSSGHSGNLSQGNSSTSSQTGGPSGCPSGLVELQQQQMGQQEYEQQQQQSNEAGLYNQLDLSGMPSALYGMGNNNAGATIGVPLAAGSNNSANAGGDGIGQKRKSEADMSVASKSQKTKSSKNDDFDNSSFCGKAPQVKDEAELEKMTPAERRRYERNLREQQRSYRISQQIKQLRDVLEESKIPFKPNKFSILVSVVEYIKQLQTRAIMLDSEHHKLIDTIRQTNELVSSGQVPSSMESSNDSSDNTSAEEELTLAASKDMDFRVIFQCCPSGMAVCSLDGRILGCNKSFEVSLGVKRQEVLQQSMFIYIRNHQDIFEAMADLLKRSSVASEAGEGVVRASHLLFWCGHVMSLQNRKSALTITLTSTSDGNPKYFTLTVAQLS